jgi:hypothetical protein
MTSRRAWVAAAAVLLAACERVPDLGFPDAGRGDAGDASPGDDATADAGCPTAPPPGATCCGSTACYGSFCNAANCVTCQACAPGEICCSKMNNAVCQQSPVCH